MIIHFSFSNLLHVNYAFVDSRFTVHIRFIKPNKNNSNTNDGEKMMNIIHNNKGIDPFTMQKALIKGRKERSRAFHALWKAAVNSIR